VTTSTLAEQRKREANTPRLIEMSMRSRHRQTNRDGTRTPTDSTLLAPEMTKFDAFFMAC